MQHLWNLYRDAFRGLSREIWLLSAVIFVNRCGAMVLTFLTLYLTQELGMSLAVAGQVLSVYGLGHLLGAWLGGWLCDRLGFLRIQLFSLALSGLGFLAMEHAHTLPHILAITLFVATTAEAFRPANSAALAALSPPHLRTRAVALNRMALNLGWGVGPAVGGWLATYDYAWLFRVDGVTCLVAAFFLHYLFHGRSGREPELNLPTGEDASEVHPLSDRTFLAFLVVMGFFCIVFYQSWGTFPFHIKEVYGFSEARFGLLMALNAVLIILFEMILTHRGERYHPLTMVGFGCLLVGFGMAVLPLGATVGLAVLSVAAWTFGEMLSIPFAGGWVANRAGAKHRGKYMGLYTMAWGAAFIVAPALGAWVYEYIGPDTLWYGCGILCLLLFLGCEALRVHGLRARALA
jgi:MFS family permease